MSIRTLKLKVELETLEDVEKAWNISRWNNWIWNLGLEERKSMLGRGEFTSCYDQQKQLPLVKDINPDLKQGASRTYQHTLRKLDTAFSNFWKLRKEYPEANHRLPKFRSRKYFHTVTFDGSCYSVKPEGGIRLNKGNYPINISKVKLPSHVNELSTIELSYDHDLEEFYLSVSYHVEDKPTVEPEKVLAIDLGIKSYGVCCDSEGKILEIENTVKPVAKHFDSIIDELKSLRSRCTRGSRRWKKLTRSIKKLGRKKVSQIRDILHPVTNKLVEDKNYSTFVVGELDQQQMTKSTQESNLPKNLKKAINRSVYNNWFVSHFISYLTYKAASLGKKVVKISERGTTRTCNNCNYVFKDGLNPSVRTFSCPNCELELSRDVNAAINILNKYLRKICGMNQPIKITSDSYLLRAIMRKSFNCTSIPDLVFRMEYS